MSRGEVDCVVTGADRIAANGDAANKIGTYGLAVAAAHHGIPFYVVAPTSTIDPATRDRRGNPDRGARRRRDHVALRRAQSGLRRHAGRADRRDRDRGGRAPGSRTRSRCRAGRRGREGDRPRSAGTRRGSAADRRPPEGAAAGRRPADARLDPRADPRRRRGRRVHVVTNEPFRAATSSDWAESQDGVTVARRRHDARTTTGSARSATSRFTLERGGDRRRRRRRGRRRQPLRRTTSGVRRLLARQGRRERGRGPRRRRSRGSRSTASSTLDARGPRRRRSWRSRRDPPSTLVRRPRPTSTTASTLPLVEQYLARGERAGPAGQLRPWLHAREPVYGYTVRRRLARHRRQRSSCSPPTTAPARARASRRERVRARQFAESTRGTSRSVTPSAYGRSMLLDVLLPEPLRRVRAARRRALCAGCRDALIRLAPPLCARCGAPGAWPVRRCARSAADGGSRSRRRGRRSSTTRRPAGSSQAWKERGQRRLAREAASLVVETLSRPAVAALAFVPLGRRPGARAGPPAGGGARARARRALGAAGRAARPAGAVVEPAARARAEGAAAERRGRLRARRGVAPARVCLVDDVYTSGATAAAAASALREGGARRVEVVTLARAVR